MPVTSVTLVDEPGLLAPALQSVGDLPVVGVDVERADWDRYFRAAALVQLGGEGRVALVDPLRVGDLSPLHGYLGGRVAVFHACENDVGPLADRGVTPPRIEDTAVAAALLGLPTGLGTLLASELGVELSADKAAMQRADWEARPLTPEMLAYAAEDVADLPGLWAVLSERLDRLGRWDWYRQELTALLARPSVGQRRSWTRVKGAGRLDEAARRRLRALWRAREDAARRTDTAPARVAGDRVLLDLATRPPARAAELTRRGMRRQAAREFGHVLLAAVREADGAMAEPSRSAATRLPSDRDRALADRLRSLRGDRARALGLDPGVLCPSHTLMGALLTDPRTPTQLRDALGLRPWQWQQVGDAFCETLGLSGPGRPEPVPATPAGQEDD